MPTELSGADPTTLQSIFKGVGGGRWEQVIYYRTPQKNFHGEDHAHAGWIEVGDAQALKLSGRAELGYMPLKQFGAVDKQKDGSQWHAILSHPDGPRQFPVSQILQYRWYNGDSLRHDWPQVPAWAIRPDGRVSTRFFPQLKGLQLEELPCPNCHGRTFLEPNGLFQHMVVHHDLEPVAILALGDRMGIDFTRRIKERAIVKIDYGEDEPEPEPDDEEDDGFSVSVRTGPTGKTAGRPRNRFGQLLPGKPVLPDGSEEDDA